MLGADPMMDSEHLPLEMRPSAFQPVDVAEIVPDVLADAVVDRVMMEPALQADIARELIAHDVGAGLDVFNDLPLYGLRLRSSTFIARRSAPRSIMPNTAVLPMPPVPACCRFHSCLLRSFPPTNVSSISTSPLSGLLKDFVLAASRNRWVM